MQPSAWCAVEGECGTLSEDVNAISGAYGWTHWDNCIGSPAGYIPPPSAAESSKVHSQMTTRKWKIDYEAYHALAFLFFSFTFTHGLSQSMLARTLTHLF